MWLLAGFLNQPITSVFCLLRVLIGSPLSGQPAKRTGDVYKCPVKKGPTPKCIKLELPGKKTVCVSFIISVCIYSVYMYMYIVMYIHLVEVCKDKL